MTDRELMQQALSTLEGWAGHGKWVWPESALEQAKRNTTESITALRAAIEQAQEPVAWAYPEALEAFKKGNPWVAYGSNGDGRIPLYLNDAVAPKAEPRSGESGAGFESLPASPTWWDDPVSKMQREWKGLTDEEREHFRQWAHPDIIEAIELKLQERNT